MDAFESLVSMLLQEEGFWVCGSYKVDLTKKEKAKIDRPSSPRWELDLLAYKPAGNEVWVVECKSYLNSTGVKFASLTGGTKLKGRYKLFNEPKLQKTIFSRLRKQLVKSGLCLKAPKIRLCLAAGRIASEDCRKKLHSHFVRKGWKLLDEQWIIEALKKNSKGGYQNHVASLVAKLLLN